MTVTYEWIKCLLQSLDEGPCGEPTFQVLESDCRCGEHGPGTYNGTVETALALRARGIKPGEHFWIAVFTKSGQYAGVELLNHEEGQRRRGRESTQRSGHGR